MVSKSTRSILVRLGLALCLLGAVAGVLAPEAKDGSGQVLHDRTVLLSWVAVVVGLLLAAAGVVFSLLSARTQNPGLYHGPESSTLSFAPPSLGSFPVERKLPNLRRTK